jgi:hypothetical protein
MSSRPRGGNFAGLDSNSDDDDLALDFVPKKAQPVSKAGGSKNPAPAKQSQQAATRGKVDDDEDSDDNVISTDFTSKSTAKRPPDGKQKSTPDDDDENDEVTSTFSVRRGDKSSIKATGKGPAVDSKSKSTSPTAPSGVTHRPFDDDDGDDDDDVISTDFTAGRGGKSTTKPTPKPSVDLKSKPTATAAPSGPHRAAFDDVVDEDDDNI